MTGPGGALRAMAVLLAAAALIAGASRGDGDAPEVTSGPTPAATSQATPAAATLEATLTRADVIAVSVEGEPGAYTFDVTVRSPDTGCDQYADWWEVISAGGDLVYRRVLLHSHVDEQPFTRSGGPVDLQPVDQVLVRAHITTAGYGGAGLRGSPSGGFTGSFSPEGFAADLETRQPQPSGCAY
jgi:hypothetical protein